MSTNETTGRDEPGETYRERVAASLTSATIGEALNFSEARYKNRRSSTLLLVYYTSPINWL